MGRQVWRKVGYGKAEDSDGTDGVSKRGSSSNGGGNLREVNIQLDRFKYLGMYGYRDREREG